MNDLSIRANGRKNSQVTDDVKQRLATWLEDHGLTDARRAMVFHHCSDGVVVAVSDFGVSDRDAFDDVCATLIDDHPENRRTADDCVWISRAWISDSFSWDVVESEPGRCRVHITTEARTDDGDDTDRTDSRPVADESDSLTITEELDMRNLPPAKHHELIFKTYEVLEGNQAFVLINDHDPKRLYHQFEAEAGSEFHWDYRKKEPGEFRVLIGKSETDTGERDVNESVDTPF